MRLLLALLFSTTAFAQIDFSGEWSPRFHEDQPERVPGPELGDYLGLPINDAARMRAYAWEASLLTMPEWQCRPHSADYIWRGPSPVRIWKQVNPVTRQTEVIHAEWLRSVDRPIYLDNRPHPPENAAHTWAGFSTAKWEGDMLTITTTHLKEGYIRRNGVPRSDKATLTEHWMRHGDFLTVVTIVNDPVYLTAPFIRTTDYQLDLHQQNPPYPCEMVQEVERPKGEVPHNLPGKNQFLTEFSQRHKLPQVAANGGAATMYPEFRKTMNSAPTPSTMPDLAAIPRVATVSTRPDREIQVLPIRNNFYLISGAGGNITASVGPDGVLLVDSGIADKTDQLLAAIRKLTDKPVRYILNTHMHPDHVGGNEKIAATGKTLTGGNVAGDLADSGDGAAIIAHENVLNRMTGESSFKALPTETYHNEEMRLSPFFHGNEAVQIVHQPAAHTDGDSIVYFRRADIIASGDIFLTDSYPIIDLAHGGNVQGVVAGLNRILDLAFPDFRLEGGTMIVPGHGRLSDSADVAYYRDMVTIVRDRIADMIKRGMTLDQVKAARPTADYDTRYGATSGFWTTYMFVEAVYKSLKK